jgi:hypothetical protein
MLLITVRSCCENSALKVPPAKKEPFIRDNSHTLTINLKNYRKFYLRNSSLEERDLKIER